MWIGLESLRVRDVTARHTSFPPLCHQPGRGLGEDQSRAPGLHEHLGQNKPGPHISEGMQQLLNQGPGPVLQLGEGLEALIMGLRRYIVHPV